MLIDPFNADHVAFLLYGLDDFKKTTRSSVPVKADEKLPAASRLLDSLAHLAICKPSNQVVAIGADLKDGSTGVEIIVATNEPEPEPEVTRHLQYIMDALFDIHSAIREQEHTTTPTPYITFKSLNFISADDTRPIPSLLRALELSVLRHSFPKAAAQLRKNDGYTLFKRGVELFLNGTGKDYKGPLSTSIKTIQTISFAVGLMHSATASGPELEADLEKFRHASTYLENILRGSSPDFEVLDKFFNARVGDVKSWLLEITSTRTHFKRVAGIIDSSQLSVFLQHRPVIRALANPSPSISFTITRESFGSVLDAAGWDWTPGDENEKIAVTDGVYKELAKGLRKLTSVDVTVHIRSPSTEASVLDEFDIETSYGAHCECIVLQHLQGAAIRPTEFVGVSQPSCRLCQEYFAAENDMGAGYHTISHGSHDSEWPWRCPGSGSRVLGVKLLAIVKEEMGSKAVKYTVPGGFSDMSAAYIMGDELVGRYASEFGSA